MTNVAKVESKQAAALNNFVKGEQYE